MEQISKNMVKYNMIFKRFLVISQPWRWPYLATPYLIGYILASISTNDFFTLQFLYTFSYFLLPANFFLYGINEYFDRSLNTDVDKKKTNEFRIGHGQSPVVLNFILISLIFTLPFFVLLNTQSLGILLCFLLLSAFYSAPPVRFKTMPFFDLASSLLYILPGLLGYTQIAQSPISFSQLVYLSCWPAALQLFSSLIQIEADYKSGVTTSATSLGRKWSLAVCLLLWLIFAVYVTSYNPLFVLAFIYPSIPLYLLYHTEISPSNIYNKLPYLNTLVGVLLFAYLYIDKFYL